MITFACFSPHPPILLPSVGSKEDREKVKKTIAGLKKLNKELAQKKPDILIISSPHLDWGFKVPLYFITPNFKGEIKTLLTGFEPPKFYFNKGKEIARSLEKDKKYALVASGDLSHCLKEDGPYGFQPDGPKFDKALLESLKRKDIEKILNLDDIYPQAADCGLRSFSFLLGILTGEKLNWQPEILSYEGPFGVGYLVANFKFLN